MILLLPLLAIFQYCWKLLCVSFFLEYFALLIYASCTLRIANSGRLHGHHILQYKSLPVLYPLLDPRQYKIGLLMSSLTPNL